MSSGSSNAVEWLTRLKPARPPESLEPRQDDPRLWEFIEYWRGDRESLLPGRPVLLGFPQAEGVRRNGGRPGAADAPAQIRHWLYRLTPVDCSTNADLKTLSLLDAGDIRILGSLEDSQDALAEVVAALLESQAIPVVLGGGHETAYGHYLGYANAQRPVGIINLDAHLDVRPFALGQGHSGSPFRQALEHPTNPLPGHRYVCLGAQPHGVGQQHEQYARERGCIVRWANNVKGRLRTDFEEQQERLKADRCQVYVTVDADVVRTADVPGVSAPNVAGLAGDEVLACARLAGSSRDVSSIDLVEINPRYDRDGQSARWAALVVWNFLVGLVARPPS